MQRFTVAVAGYCAVCLLITAIIVLHGDGPHPRIVSLYPASGNLYFPGGAAQITFSQSMDQASVERAVQVSPGTQGQGAWYGNTLNLQPDGDWKSNVTYHLMLTGTVTDDQGRPLRTPVSVWFRVHHIQRLGYCSFRGIRNVCETTPGYQHVITRSPSSVRQYALSSGGTLLAYVSSDASHLPHLFLLDLGTGGVSQLTKGRRYADSRPQWDPSDETSITYHRQPVMWHGVQARLGRDELWNVNTDGSNNLRLS
jgi:hypothetical protein